MPLTNPPAPTLLVLAGGLGSRYGSLKQIDSLTAHGESLLEFSVYDALAAGFRKVVFIINAQVPAAFTARLTAALARRGTEAVWVVQDPAVGLPPGYDYAARRKPWGTGQAVLCAQAVIGEPFAVLNADDFYGRETFGLAARELPAVAAGHYQLLAYRLADTLSEQGPVARGICRVGAGGQLLDIAEQTNLQAQGGTIGYEAAGQRVVLPPDTLVSMNFWLLHPAVFGQLAALFGRFLAQGPAPTDEFYLPKAVQALLAAGQATVRVQRAPGRWQGITYAADKAALVEFIGEEIHQGRYPNGLWS